MLRISRRLLWNSNATNANLALAGASFSGKGVSVTGSAGYRFDIGSYFVEPSVGVVWSSLNLGSLAVPGTSPIGGPTPGSCCVPIGTLSFDNIESLIGRAGVRVGTIVQNGGLAWQPFVAASVWDEFAPDATSTFTPTVGGFALNTTTSRVGVFRTVRTGNRRPSSQYRLAWLCASRLSDRGEHSRLGPDGRNKIPIRGGRSSGTLGHEELAGFSEIASELRRRRWHSVHRPGSRIREAGTRRASASTSPIACAAN